jgi:hypothetical protein
MDKTIYMAREAGAIHIHERPKEFAIVGNDSIKAFEALVRADERSVEREACAKVCDEVGLFHEVSQGADLAFGLAAAIRARGNT